jgi:hypothetical protein
MEVIGLKASNLLEIHMESQDVDTTVRVALDLDISRLQDSYGNTALCQRDHQSQDLDTAVLKM